MDTMIITRKFVLLPVASYKKEWAKKSLHILFLMLIRS